MFSNRQQNSSNVIHQTIPSSNTVVLPPPPPAISISSGTSNCNNLVVTSVATTIMALDGLNCGGIPTRTTPTLTPTTLRTIAADIVSLSSGSSEDFAAAAASDLHHLVSSSCNNINTTSELATADRLNSDLQERHDLQNLGNQHITIQNLNNQHINLNDLQNNQQLNQNSLNQQQREDYNNSFSTASSRQAGFVPPLVLQINSNNTGVQQPLGTTILLNNNNSSNLVFNAKGSSTSTSSSHWQGVVVTQRPQRRTRSAAKRRFTDDEDVDLDYDSAADDGTDSSDTTSGKTTRKQNTKNKSNSKNSVKNEFKTTTTTTGTGSGRRTNNKDNKMMSAEEEQRRQIRRERNKLAAARCRKRRMDHTNELLEETEQLEDKRLRLQVEIQGLRQQKNNLQQMLAEHKCAISMNNGSVSAVNHATSVLDVKNIEISESDATVMHNSLSTSKGSSLLQQHISANVTGDNDGNHVGDILIKCEDTVVVQPDEDNKDNIEIIPTTVLQQQPQRRRPTTLLQLNNGNFGNLKKNSGNGVVVLNFDSLMDGGTGLTPVSANSGSVQNHHQQIQRGGPGTSGMSSDNNGVLS